MGLFCRYLVGVGEWEKYGFEAEKQEWWNSNTFVITRYCGRTGLLLFWNWDDSKINNSFHFIIVMIFWPEILSPIVKFYVGDFGIDFNLTEWYNIF